MRLKQIFSFKWFVLALLILALLGTAINVSVFSDDSNIVAWVGKEKIMVDDFIAEYKKHERYFQSMFNFALTEAQLREMGIGRMVLSTLIQDTIMAQLFKQMGLYIDSSIAIDKIKKSPTFHEEGKFSRAKLSVFLDRNDLTEKEYIKKVKQDIGKEFLFGPFFNIQGNYRKLAELFYNFKYGLREVAVARITASEIPPISIPTESEIISFYNENKDKFFSEEYRSAEYLLVSDSTVKEELIAVPEKDVQKSFDNLQLGKRYYINYIEFESRDEAERMKKSIVANPEFYANDLTSIEGALRSDLPQFLPTNIQWDGNKWFVAKYMGRFYLYTVVKIVSVSNEERRKIFGELSQFMRLNKLNQLLESLREEIASGVDWKTIEEKYGAKIGYVPLVSKFSLDKEDNKVNVNKQLLDEIFSVEKGTTGEIVTPQNELIIFTVTSLEPLAEQPFIKVRSSVLKAFFQERRKQVIYDLLMKQQKDGENTEKVELNRLEVVKLKKGEYKYSDVFIEEVYRLNVGDITKLFESDEGFFVGKVLGDKNPVLDESLVKEIQEKIQEEIGFSMLSELTQAAMKDFKVKVNTDLVKELL